MFVCGARSFLRRFRVSLVVWRDSFTDRTPRRPNGNSVQTSARARKLRLERRAIWKQENERESISLRQAAV